MTRTTGKCELVKAALESIAYQVADIVRMMRSELPESLKQLCADGAPVENKYLMKFQSDILGIPVVLPANEAASAQGAAYMAGMKIGFYDKKSLFSGTHNRRLLPSMGGEIREEKYQGWKKAVEIFLTDEKGGKERR